MSETNATPTPEASTSAAQATDTSTETLPVESQSQEASAAAPETKRKRKRRRKRKPGGSAGDASSANSTHGDAPATKSQTPVSPSGENQKRPATGPGAKKRGRGHEPPRKHHRDAERPLRTQEQLASWRWNPTNSQLRYFPTPSPSEPEALPASDSESLGGPSQEETSAEAPLLDSNASEPTSETLETGTDEEVASSEVQGEVAVAQTADASRSAAPPAARAAAPAPRWSIPSGDGLGPWLDSVLERCPPQERAALLTSLCSHRSFRQHLAQLSETLLAEVLPLAAVYDGVFLDTAPTVVTGSSSSSGTAEAAPPDGRETLMRGLAAIVGGGLDILRSWPLAARERLSELAEEFELVGPLQQEPSRLFFDAPKMAGRLGLRAICDALSRGDDAKARELINSVGSQPGVPGLLPMLTEALEGQRFGSLVILSYGGAQSRGPDPKAPKRHSGFCLESQRDVWIRTGESQEAAAFEHYSQVHRRALLPGVVGLYSFGVTRSRKPYAAVLRKGISLQRRLAHGWGLHRQAAVGLATELTLLSSGLCRAGLRLPDLDARRFELDEDGRLWTSDLWGAELIEPRAQDNTAVSICRETVVHLLANQPGFTLPAEWHEVLSHSADFETIVATLRKLEKSRFWRS